MAEGGAEFGREDTDLDYHLDHDDDDDEQEVNRTQPFQPGASSTPYHGGEQVEMQTMQHEQSGLPDTSYQEETPLLGDFIHSDDKETRLKMYLKKIKEKFPKVEFGKMDPIGYSKKGNTSDIVSFGPRGGETKIFKSGSFDLPKSFIDKNSSHLGPIAEDVIVEDRDTNREQRQRLKEGEKQLKQAEKLAAEKEKVSQEMQDLQQKIERTQAKIDALQDVHGSNVESEAELRRLMQQKKNYQTDFEKAKTKVAALAKQAKKNRRSTS